MLFLKEQRTHVEAEVAERGSAAVNTLLGQRWKSLTKEQQAKYFSQAKTERLLHSQQHPEWSTQDNYGKRRKTQRSKASRLDSLKTVSTSLTSPLALTQTRSPPTETQTQSTH
ncbi:transcription factor 7-like 1 [Epinephelus lanceolatus]